MPQDKDPPPDAKIKSLTGGVILDIICTAYATDKEKAAEMFVRCIESVETTTWESAIEQAAEIAKSWGYTLDRNNPQPWAKEANRLLRVQNHAISKKILELKGVESCTKD